MDEEKRFISMLSDYGFKVTFGNEKHPQFLKKALQALIDSPVPIQEVTFTKNEVSGTTLSARSGLFDITCKDEFGQVFIVEMQLANFSNMIHRSKFYAFHVFNTMVRKGDYHFDDLKKIYTVSILAGSTYSTGLYHQIGAIRNQQGELIDDQITHVIIELGKFHKTLEEIDTDLDKLLYTMKLTDTAPQDVALPDFMREGWLEETLAELDRARLTPEERAHWEMTIAGNMSMVAAHKEEVKLAREQAREEVRKEMEVVKREAEARVKAETEARVKAETEARMKVEAEEKLQIQLQEAQEKAIINFLSLGALTTQQIAEAQGVSKDFVESIKRGMKDQP